MKEYSEHFKQKFAELLEQQKNEYLLYDDRSRVEREKAYGAPTNR